MRVATRTLYQSGIDQINTSLKRLTKTSEMVATGKKINRVSDDPTGYTRLLSADTSISAMNQIKKNIVTGASFLSNTETILATVQDTLVSARDTAIQMVNGTMTAVDRETVAEQINDIILNLKTVSGTKINGSCLFSGKATDTAPFQFDNDTWPTSVSYKGSDDSFQINTGSLFYADVSIPGDQAFFSATLRVDSTNQHLDFSEYPDSAPLTAVIPEGDYSPLDLAKAMESAMEEASKASFRLTGITNSEGLETTVTVPDGTALTQPSASPFQVQWDGSAWTLEGNGGYSSAILMPESGGGSALIDVNGDNLADITIDVAESDAPFDVSFEITAAPSVDYSVTWDENSGSFSIEDAGGALSDLALLWESGPNSGTGIGEDIGFGSTGDDTGALSYSGEEDVTWGIFQSLMDLRDALKNDDTEGISRGITRLNAQYDHITAQISLAGIRESLLETRDSVIDTLLLNLETEKGGTEDTDMVKSLSDLSARQTAYEAALSANTTITSLSILDYL
jgi:flagellar hook-associated protein 3 FlgL